MNLRMNQNKKTIKALTLVKRGNLFDLLNPFHTLVSMLHFAGTKCTKMISPGSIVLKVHIQHTLWALQSDLFQNIPVMPWYS